VHPGWNSKVGKWTPASSAIERRAKEARVWLRDLAAKEEGRDVDIVVVTHGGYLHYMTEDWEGMDDGLIMGTGWENTEWRSYEFVEGSEGASLKETGESRERRRGKEIGLTEDEQRELKASREREWKEKGFLSDAKL
jgi:broad specificity phosphatase PhoE